MRTAAAALAVVFLAGASASAGAVRPVVMELYTSQGCSSCAPAQALAAKLTQNRPDVLLLSFSVTYWDMFGWKDTLACPENTARQKAYAGALRRGGVYTPQIIIDGIKDVPGSREEAVSFALELATIVRDDGMRPDEDPPAVSRKNAPVSDVAFVAGARVKTLARSAWSTDVTLSERKKNVRLVIEHAPDTARHTLIDSTIWLFRVRSSAAVKIGGGDNKGQSITYHNVVTDIENLGRWHGETLAMDLPHAQAKTVPFDSVAVVVQQGGYGRVIGAAYLRNVSN
jgi:hypothetical protein